MAVFFEHVSFAELLLALKSELSQTELARRLGMSPPQVNQILHNRQHLVYDNVSNWRKSLKLSRRNGDYFELLALIHAFSSKSASDQQAMLARAFHLAGRLEDDINPEGRPAASLLYWLDPLVSVIRNMTELHGFPSDERHIGQWVADRLTFSAVLDKARHKAPERIDATWRWLVKINAVMFDAALGRWVKTQPVVLSAQEILGGKDNAGSVVLLLNQLVTYQEFAHSAGTPDLLGDKLATFSIPSKALPLLEKLSRDFLFGRILRYLSFAVNEQDLERLKDKDPDYYREVLAYRQELLDNGYSIPTCSDRDVDTTVQVLLAARRLTK